MTSGAAEGLLFCTNVLIPSLFPFMVLSSFIVKCGLSDRLSFLLSPLTRTLFKLPGCAGVTILLGMVGGYPVGARGIMTLREQNKITKEQAKRMSLFLVGGGPAFIVFVIGDTLLFDRTVGIILWSCQVAAQILLGIVLGFTAAKNEKEEKETLPKSRVSLSSALVESCNDGVMGIIGLCGLVVLFSTLFGMAKGIGLDTAFTSLLMSLGVKENIASSVLPVLWEVTKGSNQACSAGAPVYLLAFALGWGGICVHFQVYAQVGSLGIAKLKFMVFRFLQGIISAALTVLALQFYTPASEVFSTLKAPPVQSNATTYLGSVALILLFIFFLISIKGQGKPKKAVT